MNYLRWVLCLLFAALIAPSPSFAGQPAQPVPFKHAGVINAWKLYSTRLTFGSGQTLALVDDGCKLSMPEWSKSAGRVPKVLVTYDSVDGDSDPKHEGRGYHGSTVGIASSVNYKGKWGVAYNNQVAVIRALECCHCKVADGKTVAKGLDWIIKNHRRYRITTVNLAPVDDKAHSKPVPTDIDAKLAQLRKLGIWVSAPTGNHNFTTGISWPACQPGCYAIGAVRPGKDEVTLDRHAAVDLVVPAHATSSSNSIACGAAMLIREAITNTGYNWRSDGTNLAAAIMKIMQKTGVAVHDPATSRSYQRLDLVAALNHVYSKQPIRFKEHLLKDKYGYTFGIAAADLDGDGDLDLTNPDILNKSHSTLNWFENDGKGKFRKRLIFKGEPGWFERHAIGDINGDGTPDVAIVNNLRGEIVWFANTGKPATGPWKRYVITTKCPKAYDVALGDLDGDGDLDAVSSGYVSNLVIWYENPGKAALGKAWKQRVVDKKMPECRTIAIADFNRDGKLDLLATAVGIRNHRTQGDHGSRVVWYENTGSKQQRFRRHLVDKTLPAAVHGHPADIDKDGDLDIVMAHGMRVDTDPKVARHSVVWYENISKPKSLPKWKRHKIGNLRFAFEAIAADIDRDGDLDVVASAWSKGDRIVWFENLGSSKWKQHVIRVDFRAANQVIAADLNGDKWLDIVAGSDDGSRRIQGSLELRWWQNLGTAGRSGKSGRSNR